MQWSTQTGVALATIARRMRRLLLLTGMSVLVACTRVPSVDYFRQIPGSDIDDWLGNRQLTLAPFVSGSIHTPSTLAVMPQSFHAIYPETSRYRALWARERDIAAFLHREIQNALRQRLSVNPTRVKLSPDGDSRELKRYYHAGAHLELGGFRAVLFDPRAMNLGEDSDGSDSMAPFRKAFIYQRSSPPGQDVRIVTGYLGLHCVHELVGRSSRDRVSTQIDWLIALVDSSDSILAQAYVGATNSEWICPVSGERWRELVGSLADQFIAAILLPHSQYASSQSQGAERSGA